VAPQSTVAKLLARGRQLLWSYAAKAQEFVCGKKNGVPKKKNGGLKRIGRGSFATVYSCGGYAVKRIANVKVGLKEAEIALEIKRNGGHRHIVELKRVIERDDEVIIVMQLAAGDARSLVPGRTEERNQRPYIEMVFRMTTQVAKALEWMHGGDMSHNDIKPDNVLFTSTMPRRGPDHFLLTDISPTNVMSPVYAAREQIRDNAGSPAADMFALGALVQEMLTGDRPRWVGEDDMEPKEQGAFWYGRGSGSLKRRPPVLPASCPELLRDIIESCMQDNPDDRPTAADVVRMLEAAVVQ
tara:strand:+ start:1160 stop:2053 length:894 start_codon:yes stop_codon:yes gene_type:complete